MTIFLQILEQSLVFLPFSLGMLISYGVLKKADLTVDGSFVLGGGVFAKLLLLGFPATLAMVASIGAGCLAGLGTSLLQYRDRISSLISGILALFILQSVNLITMGRPNLNILNKTTLLNSFDSIVGEEIGRFLILSIISILLISLMYLLLSSKIGIMLRAFGCNSQLLNLLGKKAEFYRFLGLALSNGLVAYSGALTAQFNGYADTGIGTGVVLIGIATVIIGKEIEPFITIKVPSLFLQIISCSLGVVVYFSIINFLASLGINPLYLKMLIGCTLALVLSLKVSKKYQKG
jgi:putative tryptophan/tyrosine transport system permease protein